MSDGKYWNGMKKDRFSDLEVSAPKGFGAP